MSTTTAQPMQRHMPYPPGYMLRAVESKANNLQFGWLVALILSFCYELPTIVVSSMDRANPRLFDFVAAFGVLVLLTTHKNFEKFDNKIARRWAYLVLWFTFCVTVWAAFWYPWGEAGKFSIYYAAKYLEGLFCIYLVSVIPLSEKQKSQLHMAVVIGGVVVAMYALFEKVSGTTVRVVVEGREIKRTQGTLFGCLGPTYFHIATFSATACAMTFAMANKYLNVTKRTILFALAMFVGWPALFCGSRTGIAMMMIIFVCIGFFMKKTRPVIALSLLLTVVFVFSVKGVDETFESIKENSRSVQRLLGFEGTGNSIGARMDMGFRALFSATDESYSWQGMRMPLFGGGFYAVPHSAGGQISKYRIGYGVHNAYLFAYEQGGILGLILAAAFLIVAIRQVIKGLHYRSETNRNFAMGAFAAMLAMIPAAWFGQIFWQGFGTQNFNTMLIILLVLATKPVGIDKR